MPLVVQLGNFVYMTVLFVSDTANALHDSLYAFSQYWAILYAGAFHTIVTCDAACMFCTVHQRVLSFTTLESCALVQKKGKAKRTQYFRD